MEELIREVKNEVVNSINFGIQFFDLKLIIVPIKCEKSKRYTTSYVQTGFLQYPMFLAIGHILELKNKNIEQIFYSYPARYINDSIIGNKLGDWKFHIKGLVRHEFAHIYERMTAEEEFLRVSIKKFYNKKEYHYNRMHHNRLWAQIYRDLMVYNNDINKGILFEDSQKNEFNALYHNKEN